MSKTNDMRWDRLRLAGLIASLVSEGSRILNGLMGMVPLGLWVARGAPPIQYLQLC